MDWARGSLALVICVLLASALSCPGHAWEVSGKNAGILTPNATSAETSFFFIPGPIESGNAKPATAAQRIAYENFDPAKYKGPVGKIKLPYDNPNQYLRLRLAGSPNRYVRIREGKNVVTAPTGTYRVMTYSTWGAGSNTHSLVLTPRSMQIAIAAGRTTELKMPEATAYVQVKKYARDKILLNLLITDKDGNHYELGSSKEPAFEILSSSGELLQQGSFKYG